MIITKNKNKEVHKKVLILKIMNKKNYRQRILIIRENNKK